MSKIINYNPYLLKDYANTNYLTGYCPEAHLTENTLPEHQTVLIVVSYPKQLEMFDHFTPEANAVRVVFNKPLSPKEYVNRDELYQLTTTYGLTDKGSRNLTNCDSFVFVDHNHQVVEYVLPNPRDFYLSHQPASDPVTILELQIALKELKYPEVVADMYCTNVASIMGRVALYNQHNQNNPITPSEEYLRQLNTDLIYGHTYLGIVARLWGVQPAFITLWLSESI